MLALPKKNSRSNNSKKYQQIPLIQADLMFSRITFTAKGDGKLIKRLTSPAVLSSALADVAAHYYKAAATDACPLRTLCFDKLASIRDRLRLQRGEDWDVATPGSIMLEADVAAMLKRSKVKLALIFARYAVDVGLQPPYRRGHWTAGCMSRFAEQSGLGKGLNRITLHRLVDDVTDQEFQGGRGEEDMLSFHAFHLCLIAIAERNCKSLPAANSSPVDRLRIILLRLNVLSAQDLLTFQRQKS